MNVFKKLQTAVTKKDKNFSAFDEVIGRERGLEIGDIDKLKVADLADIIRKFDCYAVKLKKETAPILEQHEEATEKLNIFEQQLKMKTVECDELNKQLEHLQLVLNTELQKNIQLQDNAEFLNKQIEHLKKKVESTSNQKAGGNQEEEEEEETNQKTQLTINADSQLLMFTNEQELQVIRNLLDQLKDDADAFVESLKNQGKSVSDKEAEKRKQQKKENGEHKKNQNEEDGEEEENDNEEEPEGEEQEDEEEYTLEELCGNTWDSLVNFNEQIKDFVEKMHSYQLKKQASSNNNATLIASYEQQLIEKQKQIDQTYQEKEKVILTIRQLENDFVDLSQKLSEEKSRNAFLEEKVAGVMKQMTEIYNEREQAVNQLKILREEKSNLTQELSRIQLECQEKEKILKEESEEFQRDLDDAEEELDQTKEELKKVKEDLFLKNKELDNKDRQEKLKIAQNSKDYSKMEQKLLEAQKDLEKQIESSHETMQRLKVLEEKRVNEKNKLKSLKEKTRELQDELSKKKLENAHDLEQKNKQLDELEEQLNSYKNKSNVKEELTKLTLEKDVKINNLVIQLEGTQQTIAQLKENQKQQEQQYQLLQDQIQQQLITIKQLQEKRELSIHEIQKLNAQIDMMKSHSNPTTQAKIAEIQNLFDRAQNAHQSSNSLQDSSSNNNNNHNNPSSNQNSGNKFSTNFRSQQAEKPPKPAVTDFLKQQFISKTPQQSTSISNVSIPSLPKVAQNEMIYLSDMKKEMESVYKEYISIAFDYEKNSVQENTENFKKLEKKINLSIKKAQDLMDTIEDSY